MVQNPHSRYFCTCPLFNNACFCVCGILSTVPVFTVYLSIKKQRGGTSLCAHVRGKAYSNHCRKVNFLYITKRHTAYVTVRTGHRLPGHIEIQLYFDYQLSGITIFHCHSSFVTDLVGRVYCHLLETSDSYLIYIYLRYPQRMRILLVEYLIPYR